MYSNNSYHEGMIRTSRHSPKPPEHTSKRKTPGSRKVTVVSDRSTASTVSSGNPMFQKKSKRFDSLKGKETGLDVFAPDHKPRPPATSRFTPTPPREKNEENAKQDPKPPPMKRSSSYQKHGAHHNSTCSHVPLLVLFLFLCLLLLHLFAAVEVDALFGLDDEDFDRDQVEDLDYDKEFERIEKLPFHEMIWEKRYVQRLIIAALAVSLVWLTSLAFVK